MIATDPYNLYEYRPARAPESLRTELHVGDWKNTESIQWIEQYTFRFAEMCVTEPVDAVALKEHVTNFRQGLVEHMGDTLYRMTLRERNEDKLALKAIVEQLYISLLTLYFVVEAPQLSFDMRDKPKYIIDFMDRINGLLSGKNTREHAAYAVELARTLVMGVRYLNIAVQNLQVGLLRYRHKEPETMLTLFELKNVPGAVAGIRQLLLRDLARARRSSRRKFAESYRLIPETYPGEAFIKPMAPSGELHVELYDPIWGHRMPGDAMAVICEMLQPPDDQTYRIIRSIINPSTTGRESWEDLLNDPKNETAALDLLVTLAQEDRYEGKTTRGHEVAYALETLELTDKIARLIERAAGAPKDGRSKEKLQLDKTQKFAGIIPLIYKSPQLMSSRDRRVGAWMLFELMPFALARSGFDKESWREAYDRFRPERGE